MKETFKKLVVAICILSLCIGMTATTNCISAQAATKLPFNKKISMVYSSGAGGWGTVLKLSSNGKFTGTYSDNELGATGKNFPNGTCYICEFSGKFTNIKKVNSYTYSMDISNIKYKKKPGSTWIKNGVKYKASYASGLEEGGSFYFYTKKAPTKKLSEYFMDWYNGAKGSTPKKKLGCYGLHNRITQEGFFS